MCSCLNEWEMSQATLTPAILHRQRLVRRLHPTGATCRRASRRPSQRRSRRRVAPGRHRRGRVRSPRDQIGTPAAWEDDFTGYVVDYGSYPDQQRAHFSLRDARHTLENASEGTGLEGSIYAGLEALTSDLLGREWQRDDGAAMKIGRCLIDANWGHSTNVVYQFCRQSPHASILLPSHGRFVGASSNPFSEYKRRPGDRVGLNWRVPSINGKRAIRHVIYDTNWWKSFTHARLAVSMGDRGCLSVFGDRPDMHRMFAEQVTAEYYIKTEGRGRTVDEWKARPEQPDNHWLDCLVGCAVAAAMQGALLFGTDNQATNRRDRVSFKDLQRKKRS
ncbi:Phage terminase large subunit (GpA) [Rubripirellula tenax]|uniref:Phage terminase large subunit (GpA) n=2 Tax=Rubripirellula tenax TaxID=2528015 RepID=A0A5C6F031_9BACT|nr:Phage terminase large subunit (GpA) [Rubripirellula tenax]